MVSVVAADGTLRFHYPSTVLGYENGENLGRDVFDFLHPDDRDHALAVFAHALETPGSTEPFECRVRAADGGWRWMEIVGNNRLDDPTVAGVVINGRDITERRRAEEALRRSEERFRSLVQHASELMVVWDARGVITYASPATIRFAGHGVEVTCDDIRQTSGDIHPDDLPHVREVVNRLIGRSGATERFVARYLRHDREYRHLAVTVTNLLHDPNVRGMVSHARDITEQLESAEAVRRSQQHFAALLQRSSDMIAVVDAQGILLRPTPNPTLEYAPGSLVGQSTLELVHPDDVEETQLALARAVEHRDATSRAEIRVRHADGSYRWFEITATNWIKDPAVGGIIVNGHDVTDRRHAEQVLRTNEEWFRNLVQHGYDIIAVVDPDARVRYVSPSVEHVLGYTPDALVGNAGFDFLHSADARAVAAHFATVLATPGFHAPIEMRARHVDGSWRWLEAVHTNLVDDPTVRGVVLNFRDVTERKQVEEQLAHQALHDALTGLPNRVLLADRLDQALTRARRDGTGVGVLFFDIDRFKLVNDARGHAVGDRLLAAVARRLRAAARPGDTVARFGGDEFVVVHEDVTRSGEVLAVAKRLCESLSAPFEVDGRDVFVTVSGGAAVGDSPTSASALLRDADAAMYRAKEDGGGTVVMFDETIGRRTRARYETENELRGALERDELAVVYQPIVALGTGAIVGMEALLRWDHPERGTIGPEDFIDLAEETGLILPIGAQTLGRACEQLVEWRASPRMSGLTISVNISAAQLRDREFVGLVATTLRRLDLEPSALNLEITESFLVEDTARCFETLASLKSVGVRLVVDDFGIRYSSLGYLNRMPLDGLKIDRLFVDRLGAHPRDAAIVSAIMAMADALGLSVVAEGVETDAQEAQLFELGCRFAQGFLFARPRRVENASALVRAGAIPTAQSQRPCLPRSA